MSESSRSEVVYEFGGFRLEPAQQRLMDADRHAIALTPKAFDTLLVLVERSGDLVTKHELLKRVWPNVVVEEAILARNVADVRKALGDDSSTPRFIETLPKRGYRFVAEVTIGTGSPARPAAPTAAPAGRTVDTLQLVAESPVLRPGESLVDAPEFAAGRGPGAKLLGWVVAIALASAGIAAWLFWT